MFDLKKYGITYDGIAFQSGKKDEKTMLMREETFQDFVEIVKPFSLKAAYLMVIYKHINTSHRPYLMATFNELALEMGTQPRVLRRYSKDLKKDELLLYQKLEKQDARVEDQYIFSMGSKFERWIWRSKLFDIIKKDQNVIYVDNIENRVDNFEGPENQRVHDGPPKDSKGSVTDPQRVHSGPPQEFKLAEIIELSRQKSAPVFSLPSINLSSVFESDEILKKMNPKRTQEEHARLIRQQIAEARAQEEKLQGSQRMGL